MRQACKATCGCGEVCRDGYDVGVSLHGIDCDIAEAHGGKHLQHHVSFLAVYRIVYVGTLFGLFF